MSSLRVLCRDHPRRAIGLATSNSILLFSYSPTPIDSLSSLSSTHADTPRCLVDFCSLSSIDLREFRQIGEARGTLGLINLNNDIFICSVSASSRVATVRPGETVLRIENVEFYCLNRSDYEHGEDYQSTFRFATEEDNQDSLSDHRDVVTDHPFLALKRLLSDGSFYYSLDFNLTCRLQDRSNDSSVYDIDGFDEDMLWNSYMIAPLLLFRSRLAAPERTILDTSRVITSVIRGFAGTLTIPASISFAPKLRSNLPSTLTVISRLSSRRAGTRFNSRGIDDDGNVANFVETETVLWIPPGISFSYTQTRGSVPVFWEQTPGLLPGQQKIEITRSSEATRRAFDKHFEALELKYGAVHILNLLSESKPGESELSAQFREHVARRSRIQQSGLASSSSFELHLLKMTEFDFHAETRGPLGYEASSQIRHIIDHALDGFGFFISEQRSTPKPQRSDELKENATTIILQQEGVFRTNCLDCLDRTNLVQTIISLMALESFLNQQGGQVVSEVQIRHSSLWADNGDALSKIYAGTGALKSSFTRHGKMSLAGAFADARKSATRLYVNTFADKARQNTIDVLLGRLANQEPIHLYDPINDLVTAEVNRRVEEYASSKSIKIWVGTFNLNGKDSGPVTDLYPWLLALREQNGEDPTLIAVAFQEIVELSPQQIMSTDPRPRIVWEEAVKKCLNAHAERFGSSKYVLLRSGQLVGAALLLYVRVDAIGDVKNVEGNVKKTGLSGMAGNKGGCAIRLELSNTKLCFVTAHLAAGFANYDERNRDYATISHGLRFQGNRSIDDHDTIIWLGDFNYRIGLGDQEVRGLIKRKEFDKLYANDQLNLQMVAGRAFPFYSEGAITFPPTYKYNIGTDEYDTSEKARIPAWCDRVLWKGANLQQTHYQAADLRISDHRPVMAMFDCTISVIDEQTRDQLSRSLYEKRRSEIRDLSIKSSVDESIDEDLDYQSITTGLPPASSDHRKWWLNQGSQVRSTIKPLGNGLFPNVHGKSNPFTLNNEPDWVDIRLSEKNEPGIESNTALRTKNQTSRLHSRDIAKPSPAGKWPPQASSMPRGSFADLDNTLSHGSVGSVDDSDISPPPVPKKPVALSLQVTAEHRPRLPPRTSRKSYETGEFFPPSNLLDERPEETVQEWKPLIPNRHTS